MDIFFISYQEGNCEENWQQVKFLHPHAARLHGIKGIDTVHNICNAIANTDFFWTIDGDNWLTEPLFWDRPINSDLILFHALDPLYNDLTSLGGVKLWRKNSLVNTDMSRGDFCLNATKTKEVNTRHFSITKFNTTAFDCWKTSFRHCVKLQSAFMRNRPHATKINFYLDRWKNTQNLGSENNSQWAYQGYVDSVDYVRQYDNTVLLHRINDYDFLQNYFGTKYGYCQ